jgi:hypothetical protein
MKAIRGGCCLRLGGIDGKKEVFWCAVQIWPCPLSLVPCPLQAMGFLSACNEKCTRDKGQGSSPRGHSFS